MSENMTQHSLLLDRDQRKCVENTIVEVCDNRGYELRAVNVRTNHFHTVISAACKPESIIHAIKSYSTRNLRKLNLVGQETSIWVRGKSRRYLWKPRSVSLAIEYVLYGQGADLNDFDEMIKAETRQ